MVFSRTPFVPLAIPDSNGAWKRNVFPATTGIYALYMADSPLDEAIGVGAISSPLSESSVRRLAPQIVYVGKTSKGGRLHERLGMHYRKIDSRENISVRQIVCRYLSIPHDWNVLFAEQTLIFAREVTDPPPPPWNTNGFGSNVPGAGRPGLRQPGAQHFNVLYPVRANAVVDPADQDQESD